MAPASGFQPSGGRRSGAGAALVFLILWAACGDDGPHTAPPPAAPAKSRAAADPAEGMATVFDGPAPSFGDALLAEQIGDDVAARVGFEHLLAAADAPPELAARAALHLAQLEVRAGKSTRHALDLVARAAALAPGDVAIAEGIAQLRADIVAGSGTGDSRGPKLGQPLPGVAPKVADAFAAAERALAQVRRFHPRPFEILLGAMEDATESVIAKYRTVAAAGGLAQVAAEYRIGSLYHDLAYGLLSDVPFDPTVAAGARRTLRGHALGYLKDAIAAYTACLAAPTSPDAELWRIAAETDLRGAKDVLGEATQ